MSWFKKILPAGIKTKGRKHSVEEGLWTKCPACNSILYRTEVQRGMQVCSKCGYHMQLGARERLKGFLDATTSLELAAGVGPMDPLRFRDTRRYSDRLGHAQKSTGEREALIVMQGKVEGLDVVVCALEFEFIAGTMGSAVGERFARAVDYCIGHQMPLVVFTASGGARLQEGMLSLLQMAKTSAALARMASAGLPYVSVLTHPTMGGVTASIGMLGDLELAEPQAQIGFAGPRVIRQTTGETLPEGFQRAEFLLDHGAVDMILDRRELRERIARMLRLLLTGHKTALPVNIAGV